MAFSSEAEFMSVGCKQRENDPQVINATFGNGVVRKIACEDTLDPFPTDIDMVLETINHISKDVVQYLGKWELDHSLLNS